MHCHCLSSAKRCGEKNQRLFYHTLSKKGIRHDEDARLFCSLNTEWEIWNVVGVLSPMFCMMVGKTHIFIDCSINGSLQEFIMSWHLHSPGLVAVSQTHTEQQPWAGELPAGQDDAHCFHQGLHCFCAACWWLLLCLPLGDGLADGPEDVRYWPGGNLFCWHWFGSFCCVPIDCEFFVSKKVEFPQNDKNRHLFQNKSYSSCLLRFLLKCLTLQQNFALNFGMPWVYL